MAVLLNAAALDGKTHEIVEGTFVRQVATKGGEELITIPWPMNQASFSLCLQ